MTQIDSATASAHTVPRDRPPERDARVRQVAFWLLVLLPAVAGAGIAFAVSGPNHFELIADDAYYYLKVAHNIATGAGSTFNGIDRTNGYHPLWMAVCVAVTFGVRSTSGAVTALLLVDAVIWGFMVREIRKIGRALERETLVMLAALPLAAWSIQLVFNGMETALTMLVLLYLIRRTLETRALSGDAAPDVAGAAKLGVVLLVLVLSRLDSIVVAGAYGLVACWVWSRAGAWIKSAVALALPAVAGLSVYVAFNWWWFDSATPVSGKAKSLGHTFPNWAGVRDHLSAPLVAGTSLRLGALTFVLAVVAIIVRGRLLRRTGLRELTVVVLAGELLLLAYLTASTAYPVWSWYQYLLPIILFLALIQLLPYALERSDGVPNALGRRGPALLLAGTVLVGIVGVVVRNDARAPSYLGPSVVAARAVDRQVPTSVPMLMGDRAGAFGWATSRPIVQAEGLVGPASWLDALTGGTTAKFIADRHVGLYTRNVGVGDHAATVVFDGKRCQRYPEPAMSSGPQFGVTVCPQDLIYQQKMDDPWGTIKVWRLRPGAIS